MDLYIVGLTTRGTARLACNWLASLQRTGQDDRTRLFCLDEMAADVCAGFVELTDSEAEILPLHYSQELLGRVRFDAPIDYGTGPFVEVTLAKLRLLTQLSPTPEQEVQFIPWLYTDIDSVFLDDPVEYLAGLDRAPDLWFQSDRSDFHPLDLRHLSQPTPDESLWVSRWEPAGRAQMSHLKPNYCMGCVYSPTEQRAFWQRAREWLLSRARNPEAGRFISDQEAVNELLAPRASPIKVGVLSPYLWLNGGRPWPIIDDSRPTDPGTYPPIFLHANYIVGAAAKEARLRERGCWYVRGDHSARLGL